MTRHVRRSLGIALGSCSWLVLAACGGTGGTDAGGLDSSAGGTSAAAGKSGAAGKAGASGKAGAAGKGGASGAAGAGGVAGGKGGATAGGAAGASAGGASAGAAGAAAGKGGSSGGGGATAGASGGTGTGGSGTAGTAGKGGSGTAGTGTAGTSAGGTGSGTGGSSSGCNPAGSASDPDQDKDGFTVAMGDCNDCDASVNPGAVDVLKTDAAGNPLPAGMQVDNDCDGAVANPGEFVCDAAFAVDDPDPFHGANAIELCQKATGSKWGVVSAQYVQIDGAALPNPDGPLGHGLLSGFGPNVHPQKGARMLGLSSGTARQPTDPGYQSVGGFDKGYTSGSPPGFPLESPACPGVTTGEPHDSAALKLAIKVPTNAKSFSFKFKFYTYEFPFWICSEFNDFFTVLMDPPPSDVNPVNKNITFDSMKNPVSVNNAFLEVCSAQQAGGKNFPCPAGIGELAGTGFEDHAATVWLKTNANVTPGGTITLTFGAFDSGDGILDSTGIVDDFEWSATAGTGTVTGKP